LDGIFAFDFRIMHFLQLALPAFLIVYLPHSIWFPCFGHSIDRKSIFPSNDCALCSQSAYFSNMRCDAASIHNCRDSI